MLPEWLIYSIAAICGLLTWRDIKWGLTGIAIAIGISPEYRTEFAKDLRLEDFVMIAVFLAWILHKMRDREPLIPYTPLNGLWGFWIFTGAISVLMGFALGTLPSWKTGFLHWFKRIELAILFWMVADRVRSLADVRWLAISGMIGALLSSYIGWQQRWIKWDDTNGEPTGPYTAYRISGPVGEKPNVYAQYLVFNSLVGFALAWSLYPLPGSWFPALLAGLTIVPILFSFSRSAIAALVVGLISLTGAFHRKWLPIVLVAMFVVPLILPSLLQDRLRNLSWENFKAERLGGYIGAIRETLPVNPITGRGLGFTGFNRYENQYANTLAHEGILGLIAFLALIWGVLKMHNETLRLTSDPYLRGVVQGCFAGTIAFCIAGLSGVPMLAIRTSETFWFWTGLCAGIWRLASFGAVEEIEEQSQVEFADAEPIKS
ncbi:MAG: hypothetical protein NZ805_03400 [Armatimonadetes bacterium]|nr:hypothetical protein [Armatimonadota bacterium]MDW8029467.1 hypothetical protein [Armatimonadota bacterium]